MYRPSRGAWESATTTRYEGSFFLPVRVRRIFTAIFSPPESVFPIYDNTSTSRVASRKHIDKRVRRTRPRGGSPPPRLRNPLEHPFRLLEVLEDAVHILDGRPAPQGDPFAAAAVDDLRIFALRAGHRVDDRHDPRKLLLLRGGPSS